MGRKESPALGARAKDVTANVGKTANASTLLLFNHLFSLPILMSCTEQCTLISFLINVTITASFWDQYIHSCKRLSYVE
ncbi:hypothetical protein J437_LFUL004948 [Ladona fulva]|uniref:Uncharacterized protein n=1 Tax=Ladona fulva TaxID=123851 RepID=A0A8K0KRL2_LADFU|nr:hypothetical protein J437_LFUL004948 [Ladona fulva]